MFNVLRHATGHAQCGCDGRQDANRCLNHELPYLLVILHSYLLSPFISHRFLVVVFNVTQKIAQIFLSRRNRRNRRNNEPLAHGCAKRKISAISAISAGQKKLKFVRNRKRKGGNYEE